MEIFESFAFVMTQKVVIVYNLNLVTQKWCQLLCSSMVSMLRNQPAPIEISKTEFNRVEVIPFSISDPTKCMLWSTGSHKTQHLGGNQLYHKYYMDIFKVYSCNVPQLLSQFSSSKVMQEISIKQWFLLLHSAFFFKDMMIYVRL